MLARFLRAAMIAAVVIGLTTAADAEDLVMPFACGVDQNGVHVSAAGPTTYRIRGPRQEQPFVDCGGAGHCRTLMVHRFEISCGGTLVPWARVAEAAGRDVGIALPQTLPLDFAPVSTMSGRFVLPALGPTGAPSAKVTRHSLSAESVVERHALNDMQQRGWQAEIHAAALTPAPDGNIMRIAAALAAVLAVLFAVSMIAAGRIRLPAFAFSGTFAGASRAIERATEVLAGIWDRTRDDNWREHAGQTASMELINALTALNAKLLHVELKVAALEPGLLLRDVLSTEVASIRARATNVENTLQHASASKAATQIRIMLRDLERISRIADSASQDVNSGEVNAAAAARLPQTEAEAFRILGINPDATPAVAKKLVDALRMSWHPDLARDEADRLQREERMKLINAAWDILKARRAAA